MLKGGEFIFSILFFFMDESLINYLKPIGLSLKSDTYKEH